MSNLTFTTKADALNFLRSIDTLSEHSNGFSPSGTYCLNHGEYSQPEYQPRRYKDGWGIHVAYFYYSGTFGCPQDGRVNEESFTNNYLLED